MVAVRLEMHGTNTGRLPNLRPTDRPAELSGADFIRFEGDKIRSMQRYFERRCRDQPAWAGIYAILVRGVSLGSLTGSLCWRTDVGQHSVILSEHSTRWSDASFPRYI
jgi:hypothetical protein